MIPNALPKTDPKLLEAIRLASQHVMTPDECRAQRRSFVIGQIGCSHPEWPRDEVEALVDSVLAERLTVHCGGPDCDCLGTPRCRALEPTASAYVDGKPARVLPYDPELGRVVDPTVGVWSETDVDRAAAACRHASTAKPTRDFYRDFARAALGTVDQRVADLISAYKRLGGLLAEAETALAAAEDKLTRAPSDDEVEAACEAGWEELRSLVKADPAQGFEIGPRAAVAPSHAAKGRAETRAALAAFLAKRRG